LKCGSGKRRFFTLEIISPYIIRDLGTPPRSENDRPLAGHFQIENFKEVRQHKDADGAPTGFGSALGIT